MEISKEEKRILLSAARSSIASSFKGENISKKDFPDFPLFSLHCGAFVTLTIGGRLRGCIGYILSNDPLIETVIAAARFAAFEDYRFSPLTEHELQKVEIEISILSVPFPMNTYDDIKIGVHGLILEEKGKRGLLLPQVPVEHKMNLEEYLDAICEKTGFPSGYWRNKQLKMNLFTADIFSERSLD